MKSRPTVLASAVLALALLGDSLLYVVLPLHASTFAISLAWVGVLLSANRIVRLFVVPLLVRGAAAIGLRRLTIAAASVGAASTLWFAAANGRWPLLGARIAWGIAFGALSLATLAYATETREGAGARVGLSLSLREAGPLLSLSGGMMLVAAIGVRPALAVAGGVSLLAIPLATILPRRDLAADSGARAEGRSRRPAMGPGVVSAVAGFVADGLFPATIGLMIAPAAGTTAAAVAAATMLALKRVAVVVASPIGGRAADRFGCTALTAAGIVVTAAGAFLIACGAILAGAGLLICGAAVTSTTLPLLVTARDTTDRLAALASVGVGRDIGAAAGPLVALTLFRIAGGPALYMTAAAALAACLVLLWADGRRRLYPRMRIYRAHACDRQ